MKTYEAAGEVRAKGVLEAAGRLFFGCDVAVERRVGAWPYANVLNLVGGGSGVARSSLPAVYGTTTRVASDVIWSGMRLEVLRP